jgi:hypothetical protein
MAMKMVFDSDLDLEETEARNYFAGKKQQRSDRPKPVICSWESYA